jgi:phosphoenolpyruvate-protein kinase (PTS system EI component)
METPSTSATAAASEPAPVLLRGTSVAGGFALGRAQRSGQDLGAKPSTRVPKDQVPRELTRLQAALEAARAELDQLRAELPAAVPEDHARVLQTHATLLGDAVFLADVEKLIVEEQLALESAIARAVADFDRIFQLVQNPKLRERAVDLRDVGLRVLRAVEREGGDLGGEPSSLDGVVLIAPELTLVDLLGSDGQRPAGIVTAAGSLAGHAALLARSLGVPTLVAVEGLLDAVEEGDAVLLDATEGVLHVRPAPEVVAQFEQAEGGAPPGVCPEWAEAPLRTLDGTPLRLWSAGGSLPEVQRGRVLGMEGVGLFRTEVLFLLEREAPSLDSLVEHYRSVLSEAGPLPVSFRLLDLSSRLAPTWLELPSEVNPALGVAGVRLLLRRGSLLRRQLAALLQAAATHPAPVEVLVPFVTDCGEVRAVKEALFEERYEHRRRSRPHRDDLAVGVVIETPAAVFGAHDLAREASSFLLALDPLQRSVLAADPENPELAPHLERLHPFTLRAIRQVIVAAEEHGTPLRAWGTALDQLDNLQRVVGSGVRDLCLPPGRAEQAVRALRAVDLAQAEVLADRSRLQSTPPDLAPPPPDAR